MKIALALSIHGIQVLEGIVPPVAAFDFWTIISHKRHFSVEFIAKDQENTLEKVPVCFWRALRQVGRQSTRNS